MNRFVILLVALAAVAVAGRHHSKSESQSASSEIEAKLYTTCAENVTDLSGADFEPVWVRQQVISNFRVPDNAVFAGFDSQYGASYVIRSDHTLPNGISAGRLIGKYFPTSERAFVGFQGVEYRKTNIEIMTHNRAVWTSRFDSRPLMTGSNGDFVCRVNHNPFWTPGRLDARMSLCVYPWHGGEVSSANFEVLRRMC